MRFNGRELEILARRPSDSFDKEGCLKLKEKQEGLFRKSEAYVERYFKLRGNLLFYLKNNNPDSDPIGVFILERCIVQLDQEEELNIILVFEGEEKPAYLQAESEAERDGWISSLHIASYECMMIQLKSLRDQIKKSTGRDPISNPDPTVIPDNNAGGPAELNFEPFLELGFSCSDLPAENNRLPNSFISVSYTTAPNPQWLAYKPTETIEKSKNPHFMTTVGFTDKGLININSKIRLVTFDVRERMSGMGSSRMILGNTNKMTQIGLVIFTIKDLLQAENNKLAVKLSSPDFKSAGTVTVTALHRTSSSDLLRMLKCSTSDSGAQDVAPSPEISVSIPSQESLKMYYENIISKTFAFPTNQGSTLSMHEYMAESKLTYAIPKQLLALWVEEEKMRIEQLKDLGELVTDVDSIRKELLDYHMSTISIYTQNRRYLSGYKGSPFKASAKKDSKELEFAPTNLHIHRTVVRDVKAQESVYDVITVGAFTAYTQRYKDGGLRRMLHDLHARLSTEEGSQNRVLSVNQLLNQTSALKLEVRQHCESLLRAAMQGEVSQLNTSMTFLADKTRQLAQVCESELITLGMERYAEAKPAPVTGVNQPRPGGLKNKTPGLSEVEMLAGRTEKPVLNNNHAVEGLKWNGTDFVKSPTEEPWELTRLHTEAALVGLQTKCDEITNRHGDSNKDENGWVAELSPLIITLKASIEVMIGRAQGSLLCLTMKECASNIASMHYVKYRRDIVFSQALTSAITGFITKLHSCYNEPRFLRQISQIGILMQFEGLLSCHKNEMGMIEDYAVAVSDLRHVSFVLELAADADDIIPKVKGTRFGHIVHVPVPHAIFDALPAELQRGHVIKVLPVFFNIGINEEATMAERFGDTAVQEAVNLENFQRLSGYVSKYVEVLGEPDLDANDAVSMTMELTMRHFHLNVINRKSKNVELLHSAAEICHKLNGVRFTSCKSAKDRTSMSLTLEQVQLLQRHHDLAADAYMQALSCLRSEGLRRENALKNIGSRKFAFNIFQLKTIPKLYRPPSGTYSNNQT